MCLGKRLGSKHFRNVFSIFGSKTYIQGLNVQATVFGSRTRIESKRVLNWSAYMFKKAFKRCLGVQS